MPSNRTGLTHRHGRHADRAHDAAAARAARAPGAGSAALRAARLAALLGGLLASAVAQAGLLAYTSRVEFMTAAASLGGAAQTVDFESLAAGTVIDSGTGVGGVAFHYDFGGVRLQVGSTYPTTSGDRYLGTDDGGVLQDGDDIRLTFGPTRAIGLYVISADTLFDGDITLTTGGTSALLRADTVGVQQTLPDGSKVYFLGLIDDSGSFGSVLLGTIGLGAFFYNVDDIVRVGAARNVPLPGTLASSLLALGLLAALRRAARPASSRGE